MIGCREWELKKASGDKSTKRVFKFETNWRATISLISKLTNQIDYRGLVYWQVLKDRL